MVSIVFIIMGVVTALAVFAILAKTWAGEPKRERLERGEIIKQLLALSERENSISAIASPPDRSLLLASTSATRNDTLRKCTDREHDDAEIEEQIRQRAYELYQERGGVDGNATDDWRQAKEEVLSYKAKAATTSRDRAQSVP
jgi:phage repressor protein C with HTH and peptisase S24 domain